MKSQTRIDGYSLVEALVAISILLIAIVSPMTIAVQGIKTSNYALEQNTAFFLAQEGIEALFALRSDHELLTFYDSGYSGDWISNELNGSGPCALNSTGETCSFGVSFAADGTVVFNHGSNQCSSGNEERCRLYYDEADVPSTYSHSAAGAGASASQFIRIITVTYEQPYVVSVVSEVVWNSVVFGGAAQTVTLETSLFDLSL